jgi:transcriptional regulator with XRE-family HTH domain
MKDNQLHLFRGEGETLAEFVSTKRAAADLSLDALSEKTGVSKATLHRIEAGRTPDPRGSTLRALAHALNVRVDELVSRV